MKRYNEGHEFLIKKGIFEGESLERSYFGFTRRAADFLGELLGGLYKLPKENFDSRWYDRTFIKVFLPDIGMCTYDGDFLTRLVFLSHDFGVRCELLKVSDGLYMAVTDYTPPAIEVVLARYRERYPKEDS